jgi:hypothetical protein
MTAVQTKEKYFIANAVQLRASNRLRLMKTLAARTKHLQALTSSLWDFPQPRPARRVPSDDPRYAGGDPYVEFSWSAGVPSAFFFSFFFARAGCGVCQGCGFLLLCCHLKRAVAEIIPRSDRRAYQPRPDVGYAERKL